jgi:hypothetical protein
LMFAADTIVALTSRLSAEFKSVRTAIENAASYVRKANNGSDFADPAAVRTNIGAQAALTLVTPALAQAGTDTTLTGWSSLRVRQNVSAYAAPTVHVHTTADITGLDAYLAALAPLVDAHLQGTPTAPTAALGTNTTQIATMAAVKAAVDNLKVGAPALYDTLAEIGTWLDSNDTELANAISFKLDASAYTAADVRAKLLTVDGDSSGLDADLLDGQHGAYFLNLVNATGKLPAANFDDTGHGARGGGTLHATATPTVQGFMLDAPNDGLGYMRKNGVWSPSTGGAHTDDAPPAAPLQDGQLWWKSSTGVLYVWYDDGNTQQWVATSGNAQIVDQNYVRKTAERRNRVVNPAMQISQENGNTQVLTANSYPVDQFFLAWSGAMVLGGQRVQTKTPNGSRDRLQISVGTIDASMTTTDYTALFTRIEGIDVADFLWGTTNAKQTILRFGFKGPAGTYSVSVQNGAVDRSYLAQFTISAAQAGTDTEQILIVPGDITGTWSVDNTKGVQIVWCLACGPTYTGALGWQAGNFIAGPGQFNGVAAGNTFDVFDVGLYLDPDKTGIPPKWELPDEAAQLAKCLRYYFMLAAEGVVNSIQVRGYAAAGTGVSNTIPLPQPMRVAPTMSQSGNTLVNAASVSMNCSTRQFIIALPSTATGDTYLTATTTGKVIANARM